MSGIQEVGAMDLPAAISAWQTLLGDERVRYDATIMARYSRSTQEFSTRPAAVLFPTTTDEVQRIVQIANEFKTPLYPISRGNNWGYGDACATTDRQVIVDLRRMNRILQVDEKLAYAIVEPGVTQQQLYEYLNEHNLPLWMDVTGAGPDASISATPSNAALATRPAAITFTCPPDTKSSCRTVGSCTRVLATTRMRSRRTFSNRVSDHRSTDYSRNPISAS